MRKLISRLLNPDKPAYDPSVLNDPVALQTEWTPMNSGGSNFKTHKLRMVHPQRAEFKCSGIMMVFCGVFLAIGTTLMLVFIPQMFDQAASPESKKLIPLVIGLIFAGAGGLMLRSALVPIVFDLAQGYFCKSGRKPEHAMDPSRIESYTRLDDVHALQIVSEYCRGDKSSYYSYELNLVLRDGRRVHAVDHGNHRQLREDAESLSQLLCKPLWDAS